MSSTNIPVRFHLSLNVSNLDKAVPFFEKLLQMPVTKRRADYAKFELDSPPLVFSLEPRSPQEHGSLNHVGFRFANPATLVDLQGQLESFGISTQREDGVECCYAKQTKFWVHDDDQRLWEFYVLEGDLDHRGAGQSLEKMVGPDAAASMTVAPQPVVWEHRMGSPFTLPNEPCDEIRLRGTFNLPTTPAAVAETLEKTFTALVPGGKVALHMLTAEETLCEAPSLPGPAAYVKHVPVRSELMNALETAGFTDIQLTTFRSGACFEFKGHPLREAKIEAHRPAEKVSDVCTVLFKGPFREIIDDEGNEWRRGEPATVPKSRWTALQNSSVASMFVELPETAVFAHCGT